MSSATGAGAGGGSAGGSEPADEHLDLVSSASREAVIRAVARLQIETGGRWVPPNNPYVEDTAKTAKHGVDSANQDAFAEVVAASCFTHCGDAWAYLGHAVDSLVRGDVESAVHFTYYAELRAALSLLATEGLVIGDRVQVCIEADGSVQVAPTKPRPASTHQAIWPFLNRWASTQGATDLVLCVVAPGIVSLEQWLALPASRTSAVAVSKLFDELSLDLQSMRDDRTRRNAASYNPARIVPDDMDAADVRDLVVTILSCLEPSGVGTFPLVDQVISRSVVMDLYNGLTADQVDENGKPTARQSLAAWLKVNTVEGAVGDEVVAELAKPVGQSRYDTELRFQTSPGATAPKLVLAGMLARAVILARLATGACGRLLRDANLGSSHLKRWVDALGLARGFWDSESEPESYLDLWADIGLARDLIAGADGSSMRAVIAAVDTQFPVIGQAERVVAWSF